MTEPNKDNIIQQNCFELISLAWQFASISSSAGVSLDTSSQDRREENDRRLCCDRGVLNVKFLSRHSCLACSSPITVTFLNKLNCFCAVNRCSFWKLIFHKVVLVKCPTNYWQTRKCLLQFNLLLLHLSLTLTKGDLFLAALPTINTRSLVPEWAVSSGVPRPDDAVDF